MRTELGGVKVQTCLVLLISYVLDVPHQNLSISCELPYNENVPSFLKLAS